MRFRTLVAVLVLMMAVIVGDAARKPVDSDLGLRRSAAELRRVSGPPPASLAGLSGDDALVKPLAIGGGPIAGFVSFASDRSRSITLTALAPGSFGSGECGAAPAVGQNCSPAGSPLSFVNTPTGSTMTLAASADLVDASTGASSPGAILLWSQFEGQPYQQVLATLGRGGAVASGYSGEFASAAGSLGLRGVSNLTSGMVTFPAVSPASDPRTPKGWPAASFAAPAASGSGVVGGAGASTALATDFMAGVSPSDLPSFAKSPPAGEFVNAAPPGGSQGCGGSAAGAPCDQAGASEGGDAAGPNAPDSNSFDSAPWQDPGAETAGDEPPTPPTFSEATREQLLTDLAAGVAASTVYPFGVPPLATLLPPIATLAVVLEVPERPEVPTTAPEPSALILVAGGVALALLRQRRILAAACSRRGPAQQ